MEKEQLTGRATPEQVKEWKAKHGDVFALKVEGSVGYVKRPGRVEISHAEVMSGGSNTRYNETVLTDCWLGGDDGIKHDDRMFFGVSTQLDEIIEVATATVEKL